MDIDIVGVAEDPPHTHGITINSLWADFWNLYFEIWFQPFGFLTDTPSGDRAARRSLVMDVDPDNSGPSSTNSHAEGGPADVMDGIGKLSYCDDCIN